MKTSTILHVVMALAGVFGFVAVKMLGIETANTDMIFSGLIAASGYGAIVHSSVKSLSDKTEGDK
jgi:hypothetical protein